MAPEKGPERPNKQDPAPGEHARKVSEDFAVRLWLDHYASHTVPVAPKTGPDFSSSDAAVEKMLADDVPLAPTITREINLPKPDEASEMDSSSWPGMVEAVPLWEDEPADPKQQAALGLARMIAEASSVKENPVTPGELLAADPEGLTSATGLDLDTLAEILGEM